MSNLRIGYIYLVRFDRAFWKIGISQRPIERIKSIIPHNPLPLNEIIVLKVFDPPAVERELHSVFSHKRISGEWFSLSRKDVKLIESHRETYSPEAIECPR